MKGHWVCIGFCFWLVFGMTSVASAADFSQGKDRGMGLVCPTGIVPCSAMLLAQQDDSSTPDTGFSGRRYGKLVKLAVFGVIAVGGWFLKWTLMDD